MKLKKLTLHSFGRYKDTVIELDDGLNVLYGPNGAGKSTLIYFLLWMLYDPESRKRVLREKLRERFRPWDGSALSGELEFEKDGVPYRIERYFDTNTKKRYAVYHGISGDDVTADFMPTAGEALFGFGQEAFLRTFFVGQLGTPFEKEGKEDEVQAALLNLSTGGDATVSAQKAIKTLEDAARFFQLKTGRGGAIGNAEEKLDRLNATLDERRRRESDLNLKIRRLEQVTAQVEEQKRAKAAAAYLEQQKRGAQLTALLEEEKELTRETERIAVQLEGVDTDRLAEAEEACRLQASTEERLGEVLREREELTLRQKMSQEQAERQEADAKKKAASRKKALMIAGVSLLVLGVVGLFIIHFALLLVVAGLVLAGIGMFQKPAVTATVAEDHSVRIDQLNREEETLREKLATAAQTVTAVFGRMTTATEIRLAVTRLNDRKILEMKQRELQKRRSLLGDATDEVAPVDYDGPAFDEGLFRQLLTELGSLTSELESGFAGLPDERTLTEEIASETERLASLKRKFAALTTAVNWIKEQTALLQNSFGPQLNTAAARVLSHLTEGSVTGVRVSGEYKMELTDAQGSHALDYFSNGTVDQAYLSLRLGILDLLEKNGDGPLILDDVFCQYDENRLRAGLAFLGERGANQQILYCTCRKENYPEGTKIINLDGLFEKTVV